MSTIIGILTADVNLMVALGGAVTRERNAKAELAAAREDKTGKAEKAHAKLYAQAKQNKMNPEDKKVRRAINKQYISKSGMKKGDANYASLVTGLSRGWNYKAKAADSKTRVPAAILAQAARLWSAVRKATTDDKAAKLMYTAIARAR